MFMLAFVMGWFAASYYYLSIPLEQQLAKPAWRPSPPDNVSNATKAEIITLLLSAQEKDKHPGPWVKLPYLDISESVFEMLPERINGVPVRLYSRIIHSPNQRIDRVTLDGWNMSGNVLTVTWLTKFYDRNSSGCGYKFTQVQNCWQQMSVDCFAAAS